MICTYLRDVVLKTKPEDLVRIQEYIICPIMNDTGVTVLKVENGGKHGVSLTPYIYAIVCSSARPAFPRN